MADEPKLGAVEGGSVGGGALETALSWAQQWHDRDPARRRRIEARDVRGVRVLEPVQIRLESLVETRSFRFVVGGPGAPDAVLSSRPTDPYAHEVAPPALEPLLDARSARELVSTVGVITEACVACEGTGAKPCGLCEGSGFRGLEPCPVCDEGRRTCDACRGACRTRTGIDLLRRFERHEVVRVHEDEGHVVGPHALLHLVEHPTEGEVVHEQVAPQLHRYVGRGAGGGYRDVQSSLAQRVDALLAGSAPETGRVVLQRLVLTRIPVYALDLGRGRTVQVFGDPPEVEPERLLRAGWTFAMPVVLALVLIVLLALFFFWFMHAIG